MWNLKNKANEQTKQKRTHGYREQTVVRGEGAGGRGETGDGTRSTDLSAQNSYKNVTYSIRNTVNNTVMTVLGARWVLEILGDTL